VGAELLLGDDDNILLGLNYNPDIPIGGGSATHRLGMTVGYKF